MKRVAPLLAALLLAAPAFAEQSNFNFHLEPAVGTGLDKATFVSGGYFKLDTTLLKLGPVAPQLEFFGLGSQNRTYLADGSAFGGGIGLRLRLLNDEKGYFFNPGTTNTGNIWGNLWVDAHLTYAASGLGVGFDAGAGYEFSLIDGLQVGPFARFAWTGPARILLFGLTFSVGFPSAVPADSDPDKDGVLGALDKCPNDPEDKDGFEDEDGCPDPDNDKDGILDKDDKCPNTAGPKENAGCPDNDKDGDGIIDRLDKCPNEPEDKDGFEDEDGCPDLDNDKDGLADKDDKCPNVAGPKENGGCPDVDTDGDGIVDRLDKCPTEPETFNGIDDEDGCPEKETKVYVTKEKIVITDKIFFEFNKAVILPKSNGLLDNVATVLNKFPQVKKVSIEGHTDDVGGDKQNQPLSEKRAKAVLDAMVARKVDAGRLSSKGWGSSKPLVNEKTPAARDQNRRVEFIILEMVPIVEEVKKDEAK